MSVSNLGQIVTRFNVEQATIKVIAKWLDTYLAEIERQNGLNERVIDRPPTETIPPFDADFKVSEQPQSIHGGVDDLTFTVGNTPEVIVQVQPLSEPVLFGTGEYQQDFQVTLTAVIEEEDEDRARWAADFYGGALMACMVQTNELEGFADRVRLQQFPKTEFLDVNDSMRLTINSSEYAVYVSGVVNEYSGLDQPYATDTGPTEYPPTTQPIVTDPNVDVIAEDLDS